MNGLVFYFRLRGDVVCIDSDVVGAKVDELPGFIKLAPDIRFSDDGQVSVDYMGGLKTECDNWPISDELKAKFKIDVDEWIAKRIK